MRQIPGNSNRFGTDFANSEIKPTNSVVTFEIWIKWILERERGEKDREERWTDR